MNTTPSQVAQALLAAGVLGIRLDQPVTFKSGIVSPVYLDNRRLSYHPQSWHTVIAALMERVQALSFEVIAGIETAGIPHSSALAYALMRPAVFVRKQAKDHGTQQRVEGGVISGKVVLLLEDQITTGGSSLSGVEALRAEGAQVTDCIAITSYGFAQAQQAFAQAGVNLHVLVSFADLLSAAQQAGMASEDEAARIRAWADNPHGWAV